jgi:hypothetical protein
MRECARGVMFTARTKLIGAILAATAVGVWLAFAWTPTPVANDRRVFMPGSQPGSVNLESVTRCDNCHGGYNAAVEPAHTWAGSMMAQAARDPLFWATVAVAEQDSIWALGNPNAGDLCLRCHTPPGWLGGRSDPPNGTLLAGSDFEGVNCDSCHRMVDPLLALRQLSSVPAETNPTGIAAANSTYTRDRNILQNLLLFDGTPFLNTNTDLPTHYGNGTVSTYSEATSGQFFLDPGIEKSGPRYDADPTHQLYYSRFHKARHFCSTCHDVSNPALANVALGAGVPERQAAASYFHVERTWSEFALSAYARGSGASTNPKLAAAGIPFAASCQDCHMRDVTGKACNKQGIATRTDLALHDLSGGNSWMLGILASADDRGSAYDAYNYAILSGAKYPGAKIDVVGLRNKGQALLDGRARALQTLSWAADLTPVGNNNSSGSVRILNNTGHKLISGYPEGRRLWLNVQFLNAQGAVIDEINPYQPLVIGTNAQGNNFYISGGILTKTHDPFVFEAEMLSGLTGETKTFHFVLATDRHKDNRIPPKGFDVAAAPERLVQPRWMSADAPGYFTADEYAGGYREVSFTNPPGTVGWRARLYYQTTSKEYIEFLRDEIAGTNATLTSPTPSGEPQAYVVQADPFFSTLKDWGKAIWDLWLHNGGSAPVLLAKAIDPPQVQLLTMQAGAFRMEFPTIAGRSYQVQRADSLPVPAWVNVGSPITGDGTVKTLIDPAGGVAQRFYRVVATEP